MLGCQRRHEFSDSNAWIALIAKYLAVTTSDNLEWHDQIDRVTNKANNTPFTLFPGTWSIVHGGNVRLPIFLSLVAALGIMHPYGTPDYSRTRTQWRSTNVEYTWYLKELGKTVQWAQHNFWWSWGGFPLKPSITIKAWASCIKSHMVLSPCHPFNFWNLWLYMLIPTSITRVHSTPGVYLLSSLIIYPSSQLWGIWSDLWIISNYYFLNSSLKSFLTHQLSNPTIKENAWKSNIFVTSLGWRKHSVNLAINQV